MECLVFARQLRHIELPPLPEGRKEPENRNHQLPHRGCPDPQAVAEAIASLRQLCWRVAGVERKGPELRSALADVQRRRSGLEREPLLLAVANQPPDLAMELEEGSRPGLLALHDLRQRLVLAELLIEAAGFRAESRGGHFRTDAPSPQPYWRRHSVQRRDQRISTVAVDQGVGTVPL
jgi:L-aspartate oxidase